jgi:hypothetical protein
VVIIFAERIQLIRSRAWLVRCVAYIRKYEECDSAWHTPCEVASEVRRSEEVQIAVFAIQRTRRTWYLPTEAQRIHVIPLGL